MGNSLRKSSNRTEPFGKGLNSLASSSSNTVGVVHSSTGATSSSGRKSSLQSHEHSNSSATSLTSSSSSSNRHAIRIALLGTGESGKTTIMKQMKILYQQGFSKEECKIYKPQIFKNCVESIQQLVAALEVAETKFTTEEAMNHVSAVKNFAIKDILNAPVFPPVITEAIVFLWFTCNIRLIISKLSVLSYIMDSAEYFLDNIERISAPDYLPTSKDILKCRSKSTGVSSIRFPVGAFDLVMSDVGGQRSERRKWNQQYLDDIVIFCVSLSEYDQTLLENSEQNRLVESLELFKSVVNSQYIQNSSVVLFLNKTDVFKRKLKHSRLKTYFPDYQGPDDDERASADFLRSKFEAVNYQNVKIFVHYTCATDSKQIKYLFGVLKETVIVRSLKDNGCF